MAMRLVIVFMLAMALTGCLKKEADEGMPVETSVTEDSTVGMEADMAQEKSVTVESPVSQAAVVEKPSIQDIQQALSNANLYEGKIDGILGPNTRKAIEAFQSEKGLKVDGKVGPKTWQKLKEYLVK